MEKIDTDYKQRNSKIYYKPNPSHRSTVHCNCAPLNTIFNATLLLKLFLYV